MGFYGILDSDSDQKLNADLSKVQYHEGRHFIVAIEHFVYADESGTQNSAYCIVAGYIGSPSQWSRFEKAWQQTLKGFSVTEFHAIDFLGGESTFAPGLGNGCSTSLILSWPFLFLADYFL